MHDVLVPSVTQPSLLPQLCQTSCVVVCLWCVQVILAVLARGFDWSIDLQETFIQTSPLPALTNGMPMRCWKQDQPMCHTSLGMPS